MGFSSEQGRVCKKHPAHEEKQGVCPSCLRDRLFHLNHPGAGGNSVSSFINKDKAASAHSSVSSSPASSGSSSRDDDYHDTTAEEVMKEKKRLGHHRNASSSDIGSMSFKGTAAPVLSSSSAAAGLKKCRSVAASYSFAPQPPKAMSRRVDGGAERFFSDYNNKSQSQGYGNYGKSGGGGGGRGEFGYGGGKKKKGFWTKLLHLKGKNKEVLIHQQHHPAMAMKGRAY